MEYLGRYTHRVALSNNRLVSFEGGRVVLRWRDSADGDKIKLLTLDASEFIRRFLLHVLPDRFVKIRHYGLLEQSRPKEEAFALPEAFGGLGKGRAGGISPRNLGRPVGSDYGKGPQSLSLLWARENDPERNPVCLSDRHGRQEAPLCWARSMRMDLWVGTYLNWKSNPEGERMSFTRRKESLLSSALFDPTILPRKLTIIIARTYSMVKKRSSWKRGNTW